MTFGICFSVVRSTVGKSGKIYPNFVTLAVEVAQNAQTKRKATKGLAFRLP